jgi:hypothetical protein
MTTYARSRCSPSRLIGHAQQAIVLSRAYRAVFQYPAFDFPSTPSNHAFSDSKQQGEPTLYNTPSNSLRLLAIFSVAARRVNVTV